MYSVFIDGKEGTTGLRIYERIAGCTDIELILLSDAQRKDTQKRKEAIASSDLTFLCLPDEAAREAVALAKGSKARLVDASSAHRTLPGWSYGFPELSPMHRAAIESGSRVSVPGCHASGFIALVYPLIQNDVLAADALVCCTSLTGYSGGGKSLIATYTDASRGSEYDAPRPYALGQSHKHLKEMQAHTGLVHPPVFSPILADFYAGMLVMVPLHKAALKRPLEPMQMQALYASHYQDSALISVLPYTNDNGAISANTLTGKDTMQIQVTGNGARMCLTATYDNLGKGASGAAVQCMNLMLGRGETKNLEQ